MAGATTADFCPGRVRLARAFNGWTQAEMGEHVGVTHQYIGYIETGHRIPTAINVEAIADVTGFDVAFFYRPLVDEFRDEECHFRRRASTPVSVRTRVLAHGTLFAMLVAYLDDSVALPEEHLPTVRVSSAEDVERAAERCRMEWGLGRDLPIKNVTRAVERAGVVVTRFDGTRTEIDAFSRAGRRSVVVLNTAKDAPCRSRFDLAHELGHLVMHGGILTGDAATEKEADRFASSLLLPRSGYVREFPRTGRLDWDALFRLKRRWGASVAAQVRRAYDLSLIDAAQYQRACKYIAAQGWRRGEPEEPEPEVPELVPLAIEAVQNQYRATLRDISARLRWSADVFGRVVGVVPPSDFAHRAGGHVVQLDLVRAERRND